VFGTLDEAGTQRQFAGVEIRGIRGRWKRSLRCKTVSDHRVIPRFSERLGRSALIFQDLDLGLSRPKPSRERPRERASAPRGQILWKIKPQRLGARRNVIIPATNYESRVATERTPGEAMSLW